MAGIVPFEVLGEKEDAGFLRVKISSAVARTPAHLLNIARRIAIQKGRPVLTIYLSIDRPQEEGRRFLPIRADNIQGVLNNPDLLQFEVDRNIVQDENNPGSESFIVEGEPPPIANWGRFDLILGAVGATAAQRVADGFNTATTLFIDRNNLNPRARGNVKYPMRFLPWLFKARDNSHDKKLFVDDGNCFARVLDELGLPHPSGSGEMTVKECIQWIGDQAKAVLGKGVAVVDPVQGYLPLMRHWTELMELPCGEIVLRDSRPRQVTPVRSMDFIPEEDNFLFLLWDGGEHIALPELEVLDGKRHMAVSEHYYYGGAMNLFYNHQTRQGVQQLAEPTYRRSGWNYMSNNGWKFYKVSNAGTERDRANRPEGAWGYLFYDFETVYDREGILKPYSVSWLLVEVDKETRQPVGDFDVVKQTFQDSTQFYAGMDSAFHLAQVILDKRYSDVRNQTKTYDRIVGVTFNGSKFDNFFLYRAFLDYIHTPGVEAIDMPQITDEFWMGTSLMNFTVDGYFSVFDLRRHLVGSLDKCCKDFKTFNKKGSEDIPSHERIQFMYETVFNYDMERMLQARHIALIPSGTKPEDYVDGIYPSFQESLQRYNDKDVTSLAELFFLYRQNNLVFSQKNSVHLTPPQTLASETFSAWVEYFENEYGEDKDMWLCNGWRPLSYPVYREIRDTSIVAGRTQCFHKPQFFEGQCVSMDVTSLYPYVMTIHPVYYPIGNHTYVSLKWKPEKTIELFPSVEKLGLWCVDVDQSHLKGRNLPYILASKRQSSVSAAARNDWHAPTVTSLWITNKEMEVLLANDCKVFVWRAILWEEKIRSIDLFGNLAELMKIKNAEDKKKVAKDPSYNPARRTAAKLASNALYGKFNEDMHLDKRVTVDADEYDKIIADTHMHGRKKYYTKCSAVYPFQDKMVVDVKVNPLHSKKRNQQRPMAVAFYILAYARMYMWEHAYSILGWDKCLYTDTDAIKCFQSDYDAVLKPYFESTPVPHWPEAEEFDENYKTAKMVGAKVYGAFENEFDDAPYWKENKGLWIVAKKMWALAPIDDDPAHWKLGTKGVTKKDIILTEEQVEFLRNLPDYNSEFYEFCFSYYGNKKNEVQASPERFFRSLVEQDGIAYVLKKDIKKHVTQMAKVQWVRGEIPDKLLKHYAQLSNCFRIMKLDPRKNQEVEEMAVEQEMAYEKET